MIIVFIVQLICSDCLLGGERIVGNVIGWIHGDAEAFGRCWNDLIKQNIVYQLNDSLV